MTTKGKGKILDGQVAFEFMGVMETEIKPIKSKVIVKNILKKQEIKTKKVFRKKHINVKYNHLKKNRKVRRSCKWTQKVKNF